jgi:MtN3 and saliva related transmembrane protein
MLTSLIGMTGALFTTLAFLPQVIKTWKSKSTKGLSMGLSLLFVIGTIFWLIYGVLINELPVIISNAITMFLAGSLLIFKIIYKE